MLCISHREVTDFSCALLVDLWNTIFETELVILHALYDEVTVHKCPQSPCLTKRHSCWDNDFILYERSWILIINSPWLQTESPWTSREITHKDQSNHEYSVSVNMILSPCENTHTCRSPGPAVYLHARIQVLSKPVQNGSSKYWIDMVFAFYCSAYFAWCKTISLRQVFYNVKTVYEKHLLSWISFALANQSKPAYIWFWSFFS